MATSAYSSALPPRRLLVPFKALTEHFLTNIKALNQDSRGPCWAAFALTIKFVRAARLLESPTEVPIAENFRFAVPNVGEVSAILLRPSNAECLLVLAHGAGAGMNHPFMTALADELASRGVATFRYQFPYMEQRRRVPDHAPVLTATVHAAVEAASEAAPDLPRFAGGKSLGGRMTSLAAVEYGLSQVRGVVFFGFPLHPPQRPGTRRAEHLREVRLPMLFFQGTRDPLADLALLRPICAGVGKRVTLQVIETADHSFHVLRSSGKTDKDILIEIARSVSMWTKKLAAQ